MNDCTNCAQQGKENHSTVDVIEVETGKIVGQLCDNCSLEPLEKGYAIQQRLFADLYRNVVPINSSRKFRPAKRGPKPVRISAYAKGAEDMIDSLNECAFVMMAGGNLPPDHAKSVQTLMSMTKLSFTPKLENYLKRLRAQ